MRTLTATSCGRRLLWWEQPVRVSRPIRTKNKSIFCLTRKIVEQNKYVSVGVNLITLWLIRIVLSYVYIVPNIIPIYWRPPLLGRIDSNQIPMRFYLFMIFANKRVTEITVRPNASWFMRLYEYFDRHRIELYNAFYIHALLLKPDKACRQTVGCHSFVFIALKYFVLYLHVEIFTQPVARSGPFFVRHVKVWRAKLLPGSAGC